MSGTISPPATTPTSPTTPPPTPQPSGGLDDNRSRLYVALTIIGGMLIVLIISVLQGQLTETQQLAAIFSGWITSIVAFYFYGQSNAQAQNQIKTSTQVATESNQRADTAEKKLGKINSMLPTLH
jgi:hypothetical protein